MHTLIDNSQTITHWIYYHTNAKLYDFIKWVFNFYVLLGNPYILNWFCKEVLRLIIHTRTSAVSLETLFNIREVIKKRLSLRPVTTIHINHSSLYCTFLLMQMGVKFKTTNNFDFFLVSLVKAKIDIKNDLKDIRANIIRKEPRKYRALKIF